MAYNTANAHRSLVDERLKASRVRRFVRKSITLPDEIDARLRTLASERGVSQSALIVHLVTLGLAAESGDTDPPLEHLGVFEGPEDLSATVDRTIYRGYRPR